MIGSIIGGAMKLGGGIFGGIKARREARKAKRQIRGQLKENEEWYNRRYNEDATQRADAQLMMSKQDEQVRERNRAAEGRAAVMGETEEAMAAAREVNAEAMADAAAKIAVAGEAQKNAVEQQYQQNKAALNEQLNGMNGRTAAGIAQATMGVADAAGSLGGVIGDLFGKKKE